jgi:hypothetical protein
MSTLINTGDDIFQELIILGFLMILRTLITLSFLLLEERNQSHVPHFASVKSLAL